MTQSSGLLVGVKTKAKSFSLERSQNLRHTKTIGKMKKRNLKKMKRRRMKKKKNQKIMQNLTKIQSLTIWMTLERLLLAKKGQHYSSLILKKIRLMKSMVLRKEIIQVSQYLMKIHKELYMLWSKLQYKSLGWTFV